jgi:hypothetical protein
MLLTARYARARVASILPSKPSSPRRLLLAADVSRGARPEPALEPNHRSGGGKSVRWHVGACCENFLHCTQGRPCGRPPAAAVLGRQPNLRWVRHGLTRPRISLYSCLMSRTEAEIEGVSIVLLGSFNPTIFQPAWFAGEQLIARDLADAAEVGIVHRQMVSFTAGWFEIGVTEDRFSVTSLTAPSDDLLRDLVLGTFRLLRYTPIRAMGLNKDVHYRVESEEVWHAIGHKLAPPSNWDPVLKQPGLRSLLIEGARDDDSKGYIHIKVEPSARVHPGLYVGVNDHYEITDPAPAEGASRILKILGEQWSNAQSRFETLHGWVRGLA